MKLIQTAFSKITVISALLLIALSSCLQEDNERIEAVNDRKVLPGLAATKITTVVSDSGVTRYRIYTDKWDVYDKASEPYWCFPKGLIFEKFDEKLNIDANFKCDSARYYDKKKLWEFRGNVRAINLQGETFETDVLFWDQQLQRIYSNNFIRVIQPKQIINAIGFESDQSMTQYDFKNINGIIVIDEDVQRTPEAPLSSDTLP